MKKTLGIVILLLLVTSFSFGQDKEEVISLLYELDQRRTKFENEITFIEEFNFGILGGINWLVQWYQEYNSSTARPQRYIMIYVVDIDTKEIKFRELVSNKGDFLSYLFSYYQNLPGITIYQNLPRIIMADMICQIGDFNNDGFDEILELEASRLTIRGYNQQEKKIDLYCNIRYGDIDEGYNSPPVEFITYKGRDGFKIRYYMYDVAGGYGYVPEPNQKNGRWFFYTWDEMQRKFIEVEEFEEGWEKTYRESSQSVLAEQNTGELVERNAQEEVAPASGKSTRFNLYIVITAAIIALGAVMVFVVVKRKK